MDTTKLIKKCPRCGTEIEPDRYATKGDKVIGGVTALSGATIGFAFGGPIGAAIGGTIEYFGGKAGMISIEDDYDMQQWFKYKCPKCCTNCKEKIHTNDNPDDTRWISNM